MIKAVDLQADYRYFKTKAYPALNQILSQGQFLLGPQLALFEKEFAQFNHSRYALGVASGHDALKLGLKAIGLQPGDRVIVSTLSYPTAMAIADAGYIPLLVDINDQLQIDINRLNQLKLTRQVKALIAVHLYGLPENIPALRRFCRHRHLMLIEDCAQAHGLIINSRPVGNFGTLGCFSFYPTKNLGAYGDGGLIVTNNQKVFKLLKQLRQYGETVRYHSQIIAGHSRLDEIQATILRVKLKHLNSLNHRRQKLAQVYIKLLPHQVLLPAYPSSSVFHQFVIRTPHRDQLQQLLLDHGVETLVHYPLPIHLVLTFAYLNYHRGDFPAAEQATREILSLPIHPFLKISQVKTICRLINQFFTRHGKK